MFFVRVYGQICETIVRVEIRV